MTWSLPTDYPLAIARSASWLVNARPIAVDYVDYGLLVELDGQLGRDGTSDRWDDLDRDVLSAVGGLLTVRVGWRQVLDAGRLAAAIGTMLQARGWPGDVQRPRRETA